MSTAALSQPLNPGWLHLWIIIIPHEVMLTLCLCVILCKKFHQWRAPSSLFFLQRGLRIWSYATDSDTAQSNFSLAYKWYESTQQTHQMHWNSASCHLLKAKKVAVCNIAKFWVCKWMTLNKTWKHPQVWVKLMTELMAYLLVLGRLYTIVNSGASSTCFRFPFASIITCRHARQCQLSVGGRAVLLIQLTSCQLNYITTRKVAGIPQADSVSEMNLCWHILKNTIILTF